MKCKHIKEKFLDFLINELDETEKENVQSHLSSCSSCREELENLSEIWTKLGVLPEEQPSSALRSRFYTMLEAYKENLKQEKAPSLLTRLYDNWLIRWSPMRPAFQALTALVLLMGGLTLGYLLNSNGQNTTEVNQLHQELQGMRQTLAVSLLNKTSPSERLKGVSLSYDMKQPDKITLEALLDTLNNDSNVNVRLSAADALYLFYDNPTVKQGIIQSLSNQSSPLVQIALIDVIINMRERRAIEAFKQLIQDEKLNPDVKHRAEQGIQQLNF